MDTPHAPPHPTPGHRALRQGRHSQPGQAYLVTVGTEGRYRVFEDGDSARVVARAIAAATTWPDARLLAWVLMPDHLHLLLTLGRNEPLDRVMQRLKAVTTQAYHRHLGRPGRLWQRAYHDHAVHTDTDLRHAARYLIGNPLRARLVQRIGDYPYWDAVWLTPETPIPP